MREHAGGHATCLLVKHGGGGGARETEMVGVWGRMFQKAALGGECCRGSETHTVKLTAWTRVNVCVG